MKNEYRMSIGQIFHPFSTPFCEVFTSAVFENRDVSNNLLDTFL